MFNPIYFIRLTKDSIEYLDSRGKRLVKMLTEVTTARSVDGKAVVLSYDDRLAYQGPIKDSTITKVSVFKEGDWLKDDYKYLVENIIGESFLEARKEAKTFNERFFRPILWYQSISLWRDLSFAEYRWLAERSLVTANKVVIEPINYSFKMHNDMRGVYSVVSEKMKDT